MEPTWRTLRGVFVGINDYRSGKIKNLGNAERDAEVLWALFSDTYEQESALLVKGRATREAVFDQLRRVVDSCTEADLVVFTFSGHASDEQYLYLVDTDPDDPVGTALPLAQLAEILRSLRAHRVVVVLDCCHSDARAPELSLDRGVPADERYLISASAIGEQALEGRRLRHGLLTDALCRALTGAGEWSGFAALPLADVLASVTREVQEAASALYRQVQRPSAVTRGAGELALPVLLKGQRYRNVHRDHREDTATRDPRSLVPLGIPSSVVDTWERMGVRELSDVQVRAVNEGGILGDGNVLVLAPTGSGKSLIADMATIRTKQNGGRTVYLAPTRALVDERYGELVEAYGDWMRVVRATGQTLDQVGDILAGRFDVAVMTFEMLGRLASTRRRLLARISLLVVDEVHHVADRERGPTLDLLLTLAMHAFRESGRTPRVVALSAAVDESGGLGSWLDGAALVREREPAVPLVHRVLFPGGCLPAGVSEGVPRLEHLFHFRRSMSIDDAVVGLVVALVRKKYRVLVFRNTRGRALRCARQISAKLRLQSSPSSLDALASVERSIAGRTLRHCLAHGVGVHIGDLSPVEQESVARVFRDQDSHVDAVVSTTTLAHGVNVRPTAVVVAELHHEGGAADEPYSPALYRNIAGRTGRLGMDELGKERPGLVITVTDSKDAAKDVWNKYVTATIPPLYSPLFDQDAELDTQVLRTIAALQAHARGPVTIKSITEMFSNTFAAHCKRVATRNPLPIEGVVMEVIARLDKHQYVVDRPPHLVLTELGEVVATGSLSLRSASRLGSTLRGVGQSVRRVDEAVLILAAQLTDELGEIPLFGRRNLPELKSRMDNYRLPREFTTAAAQGVLREEAVHRLRRADACLAWISGVERIEIERHILNSKTSEADPGPFRQVTSRTADVIDTVLKIAQSCWPEAEFGGNLALLGTRLEFGVRAGPAPLVARLGSRLTRPHCRALVEEGLTTVESIRLAADQRLLRCLEDPDLVRAVREVAATVGHDDPFELGDLGDLSW
ncbi:DEAD/DEAH box helicase [Saccharothrix sp. ALI-22-I]|uniref:DEAD/DEAH box helicase n=1 Tax=Saccharothrix sp. ALI-22-I TaxID=1933778 RepID=UPI000A03D5EA|nr:DEAD/DEAH box helicase [Saccharothrix sp. ALI-22-I]